MKVMGARPAVIAPIDAAFDGPGDRVAALFDAHEERLYRLARRLASSADEARDLVQETFLRAAASPASVPAGAAHRGNWVFRVVLTTPPAKRAGARGAKRTTRALLSPV